ncbi:MAG TPA: hypothetical protein VHI10_03835 [Mycobacterium sp.]|nr:hypothetical protein [Mycobacterium sp.]
MVVDTATAAARDALDRQKSLMNRLKQQMRTPRETPSTLWDGTIVEAPARVQPRRSS